MLTPGRIMFHFFVSRHVITNGRNLRLPRILCDTGDDDFPITRLRQTKFPIRVCLAPTTNKSRDFSLSGALGFGLTTSASPKSVPVPLSRATHQSVKYISTERDDGVKKNIVCSSALKT